VITSEQGQLLINKVMTFTSLASHLCVEILGEIYVIVNVLWSVVQSLCRCVQIEGLGFQSNVKNVFVKAA